MKRSLAVTAVVVGGVIGFTAAQTSRPNPPDASIVWMQVPLKFPVVGNVDGVKQWKFGRLQDVEQTAGSDIVLGIRTDLGYIKVIGPGPQLSDLAYKSKWVKTPTRAFPGKSDYAERMIAFDYDPQRRLIAMASLEPMPRDRSRLRRAIGR